MYQSKGIKTEGDLAAEVLRNYFDPGGVDYLRPLIEDIRMLSPEALYEAAKEELENHLRTDLRKFMGDQGIVALKQGVTVHYATCTEDCEFVLTMFKDTTAGRPEPDFTRKFEGMKDLVTCMETLADLRFWIVIKPPAYMKDWKGEELIDTVKIISRCPKCHEQRVGRIEIKADLRTLKCKTCDAEYLLVPTESLGTGGR